MKIFDIGIIGGGVSGAFACLRAAENFKDKNVILFELGRPMGKRRRQLEGWFGCFPFSDGKLYVNDVDKVMSLVDGRRTRAVDKWVQNKFATSGSMKVVKNKLPSATVQNKSANLGFTVNTHDYVQWKPESIHKLSRVISDKLDKVGNVEFSFDNEVHQILKKEKFFLVSTNNGDYHCKKILLCVGRSGWRWANDLYKSFGLKMQDDEAHYGITVEISAQHMKEFNKSHCSFSRGDLDIGPLSWNGTIIPEDHADVVISSFRSNEDRWKSDKVSFQIIGHKPFPNNGIREMERLSKLAFLLLNDRIGKEKVKMLVKGKSTLSQLPEYEWLIDTINEIEPIFPNIISRGNFHAPTIYPTTGKINVKSNLETDVPGLFVAGESAGLFGINAAAISGAIALDSALK